MCRLFYKFGRQHNAALRQWYSFGVAVAAMLSMSVVFMLLQDIWLAVAWIKEVCTEPINTNLHVFSNGLHHLSGCAPTCWSCEHADRPCTHLLVLSLYETKQAILHHVC